MGAGARLSSSLSQEMYSLNGFRKSTPVQNRLVIVYYYQAHPRVHGGAREAEVRTQHGPGGSNMLVYVRIQIDYLFVSLFNKLIMFSY